MFLIPVNPLTRATESDDLIKSTAQMVTHRWCPRAGTSSQLCIQWYHVTDLKSAVVVIFMPQKSVNTSNQGFFATVCGNSIHLSRWVCLLLPDAFCIFSQMGSISPFFVLSHNSWTMAFLILCLVSQVSDLPNEWCTGCLMARTLSPPPDPPKH